MMGRLVRIACLLIIVLAVCSGRTRVFASEPTCAPCEPRSCCTCCDNYCPKPQPCVPCAPLGCCNDYCAKPYPCPPCRLCYCRPNDYCPKPYCLNLSCCWPAWYSCGQTDYRQPGEPSEAVRVGPK